MNARFMSALILPVFLSLPLVAVVPTPGPTLQIHAYSPNPNPFHFGGVYLPYWVSQPADVRVRFYSVNGKVVRDLPPHPVTPGDQEEFWDGRNDSGHVVANGVYLVH